MITLCSQSYVDVPITEAGVDTADFCEASENLVKIFGMSSSLLPYP